MFTVSQIAEQLGGEVIGDGTVSIRGMAPADSATEGDLTFAEKEIYLAAAEQSQANAVLVPLGFESSKKILIRVKNPRVAMAKLLPLFFPPETFPAGIHPSAVVDPSAEIDSSASVGPNCIIAAGVRLGKRSVLAGNNHIGRDCSIGEDVFLHPGVVLYSRSQIGNRVGIHAGTVIGSDGYGYVFDQGRHLKMLQVGHVVIGDDVEIGANATIDRGALGPTVVGKGSKIDNLVHVAHNVVIGEHCLVMGQSGIAGSTRLGNYAVMASQSGVAGHLKIGNQAVIGAKSGVMRDVADRETVLGAPALPHRQVKRQWIALSKLPDLLKKLNAQESSEKDE